MKFKRGDILPYKIKQDLLPDGFNNPNKILIPCGLVIHETSDDGATDEDESKYFHNNKVNASAHYFVDHDSITQLLFENKVAYHAGQTANYMYLSIELCHFNNNESKFNEVWKRGVWLSADICKRYGWNPLNKVVSHNWVSKTYKETNHTDPLDYFIQYKKTFDDFINDVNKEMINISDQISDWAKVSVDKAKNSGFIKGDSDGWHPQDNVTREQLAVILDKLGLLDLYIKIKN
jgi:N-acetylmuramoyl-L-alanine amidase CwlA